MKSSPKERFQEEYVRRLPNDQVQGILCVLAKRNGGVLELDYEELLDIQDGETCIGIVDEDKLRLRYSPETTLIYTIRRGEQPAWQNSNTTTSPSSVHGDRELAEMERRQKQRENLQKQAREMRETDPLTGAMNLRTSRNSPV